jgi:hypothetical protein
MTMIGKQRKSALTPDFFPGSEQKKAAERQLSGLRIPV